MSPERRARGIDLRTVGSGGTGATNVLRTLGARASALVALLDILKGLLPVIFAKAAGFDAAVGGGGRSGRCRGALLVAVHRVQRRKRRRHRRRSRGRAFPSRSS